jgi:Tfp pilus assembly protein FimT
MRALINVFTSFIRRPPKDRRRLRAMDRHGERGFSMMELVVVSTLAITVTTIALPKLIQTRNNYNLQGDLRAVQVTIQTARYNAIAHGKQYKILFQTLPTPQMQVQFDSAANPQDPLHVPTWVNQGAPVAFSKSVVLGKGGNLVCDFSGTVTSTGFDVSAQGEPYMDLSNGSGDFHIQVSLLGRVMVVKI